MVDDVWASLVDQFADEAYAAVKGRVRTYVLHQQLLEHLPAPPATVLDVGGGAGHRSFPLAQAGYDVTLLDPWQPQPGSSSRPAGGIPTASSVGSSTSWDARACQRPSAATQPATQAPVSTGVEALAAASSTGRASSMVSAYPVLGSSRDFAKITPTTRPSVDSSGPPELPGRTCA